MSISFVLISFLFIFFLVSVQSLGGAITTHAVVGDYSQLNGENCGQSKMSSEMSSECFKWHKNSNPSMKSSRNATLADVPWLVLIQIRYYKGNETRSTYCSGSLISSQWILTAAHCLFQKKSDPIYYIVFGTDFVSNPEMNLNQFPNNMTIKGVEAYPHPGYYQFPLAPFLFDIGLIKMETPVDALDNPLLKRVRSLCLPERNVINNNVEYAMSAGWGQLDPYKEPAQLGYKQILVLDPYLFRTESVIYANKLEDQGLLCGGDSGGPLWQYSMGRAVIIGVANRADTYVERCEIYKIYNIPGYPYALNLSITMFSRVSHHIDWITSVTQLH